MRVYPKGYFSDLSRAFVILPAIGILAFVALFLSGNLGVNDYPIVISGLAIMSVLFVFGLISRKNKSFIKYSTKQENQKVTPGLTILITYALTSTLLWAFVFKESFLFLLVVIAAGVILRIVLKILGIKIP